MPKLSPTRMRFLQLVIENGGDIELTRDAMAARKYRAVPGYGLTISATDGRMLERLGLIEPVYIPDTDTIEPTRKTPSGYVLGYRYRVTDAGRAAIS